MSKTKAVMTKMIVLTIFTGLAALTLFFMHRRFGQAWMLPTAITALTVFYHFAMRLAVGEGITVLFKGREFPQDRLGFRMYSFEKGLYRRLKVKQWKLNVITAKPEQFEIGQVSPRELLHNVMQAELVHRCIMLLSFVPLLFIIPFGEPAVFIITSAAACLTDCVFVVIQRYNRPRVIKYVALAEKRKGDL